MLHELTGEKRKSRKHSETRAETIRLIWASKTPAEREKWLTEAHAASKRWWAAKTPEERQALAARGLAKALKGAKARWARMTPDERREATAKARAAVRNPGLKITCECGKCRLCKDRRRHRNWRAKKKAKALDKLSQVS